MFSLRKVHRLNSHCSDVRVPETIQKIYFKVAFCFCVKKESYQDNLLLFRVGLLLIPLKFIASLSLSLMLRPMVSRPVCLGIKHPSGAYDQIFVTVGQLRVCSYGALSLTRGRVCRLQLLLVLASAVIFGSESRRTRGHILLSHIRDFPFRCLLRLAGLRWRYSTLPPHGDIASIFWNLFIAYNIATRHNIKILLISLSVWNTRISRYFIHLRKCQESNVWLSKVWPVCLYY
jgi:hypothetical protein